LVRGSPRTSVGRGPHRAGTAPRSRLGPLALKRVRFDQDLRRGSIRFRTRNPLPPLRKLHRYPKSLGSSRSHLCLAADGRAIKRRLLCVGGEVKGGRIRVGVSRYAKGSGRTRKDHGLWVKLKRESRRSIRLQFPLRAAGFAPGRFRYYATAAWRGFACPPAPDSSGSARGKAGASRAPSGLCRSRAPREGRLKGRVFKLVRAGCTAGVHGAVRNGSRMRKRIALTFDDGPSGYTEAVRSALERGGARGTFFVIGREVSGRSSLVRKLVERGHEVANHSWSHEAYPSGTSMAQTSTAIRHASGFAPCHFRPPFGSFSSGTVSAARAHDMATVLWDIDTRDWTGRGAGSIHAEAVRAGSGSIVLMHDGGGNRSATVAALPGIIRNLKRRGYRLVTVTKLLGGRWVLREKR
jgi:peptidoglycan-N-acetylglucosamine deacetylase